MLPRGPKQIRVGHGVVVLPFSHPVHVAERIALLDIMSNGRVEFGTGRATTMDELLGFGVRPEETRPRWAEAVEAIPRMWREDPFSMHGKYWTVDPPVSVIPKPIQKPHPPIWVAATNPQTFELAAERGLGVLCFTLGVELKDVAARIQIYRDKIRHAHPVGQTLYCLSGIGRICFQGEGPQVLSPGDVVNIPPDVPDPTSGSVRPKQPIFSQRAIGGSHFFFCSSDPPR